MSVINKHKLCVAPMMDRTDRHCRFLFRLISPNAFLYTEMITSSAILNSGKNLIEFNKEEHPVGLQLGGSDPLDLTKASIIAEDYGYDEINLNVGCPSDRVKSGNFGACLMNSADLVADSITSIVNKVKIPVTIKTRIGVDYNDSYEFLHNFISTVTEAGCKTVIIHARKAILSGLSPKQNRTVPKLNYDRVYKIKENFPQTEIVINGGLEDKNLTLDQLKYVDGVMIGREAYKNPFFLASLDRLFFRSNVLSRRDVLIKYFDYMNETVKSGTPIKYMTRHMMGLFFGQAGSSMWKKILTDRADGIIPLEKIFKQSEDLNEGKYF
tara:strand:- start:139632 stop:140606 length:975 start_codon:yes stop_codon:yes gene_type:complete